MTRIGIIGTGWGSRVQVPAFRRAGLEVVAIAGHDAKKTAAIAKDMEVEAFDTAEHLIDEARVDLVSIVSPPATHRGYAVRALERGRHVLCEKPTALDASEAEAMQTAAAARPRQLALIDHELRFLPAWKEARRRLETLGRIRFAEVRYASPSRSDPNRPWNWWSDAAQGGGVWGAVGSHFVDAVRYFIGEVEAAQAVLATFIAQRPYPGAGRREVTVDDFAAVHLRLAGGALATMTFTVVAAVDEETALTIVAEGGAVRLIGDRLEIAEPRGEWKEVIPTENAGIPGDSPGGAFGTGTIHLGRALRAALDEGDLAALSPAATFVDGVHQQRVLDAARRSPAGGGWVAV
ncbi:MAG: Gfo/Idh/MocA family protein [Thermoanaerobaculia bacterium]